MFEIGIEIEIGYCMATLLHDRASSAQHLNFAPRHVRLCRSTPGFLAVIKLEGEV